MFGCFICAKTFTYTNGSGEFNILLRFGFPIIPLCGIRLFVCVPSVVGESSGREEEEMQNLQILLLQTFDMLISLITNCFPSLFLFTSRAFPNEPSPIFFTLAYRSMIRG